MTKRDPIDDMDIQAGSVGLSVVDAVKQYARSPGNVLAAIRFFADESRDNVASATGIPVAELEAYEKGEVAPTLMDLTKLAEHFNGDLRFLLEVFGHVKEGAAQESLGIAAMFSGELSDEEKLDLRNLVKAFER